MDVSKLTPVEKRQAVSFQPRGKRNARYFLCELCARQAAALGMHTRELCRLLGWFDEAICGPPRRRSAGAAACLLSSVRAVEAVSRASMVVGGTSLDLCSR